MTDNDCFLCTPDTQLLFSESESFYAMLGLGPIVEGYSILASKLHIPSFFDLPDHLLDEFHKFRHDVMLTLTSTFVKPIITEHGRVAACDFYDRQQHQSHCYHAHQLLFPAAVDLESRLKHDFLSGVLEFPSFEHAHHYMSRERAEYLYYEKPNSSCLIIPAPYKHIRQYFRLLVGESLGCPQRANWQRNPGWELIASARSRLLVKL